ncbi:MAG TPA: valine--tRNA ligase [Firmicutes bacterium]|nr:valine--tRNA ligase [Candidatus Fermentithermobacillaceae bacterium]
MTQELAKAYDPKSFEKKWYQYWMDNGLFRAEVRPGKPRFSIVIPPPNITGSLHIGHALDETIQDILVRYNRMLGNETLWLPGTDHASIATHAKIEEMLAEEGTSRWELGREKFLERAWEWRDKYGHIITDQLKALGSSCDWSRERFTMDEGCSRAVTEVFVNLYEKGLIYKGNYMVNFCPGCHTVISDIEVEHEEAPSSLWYIRYPIEGAEGEYIQVATTRPETMLGDTGIAVSPKDPRYKDFIGKYAILPLVGRRIPIFADDHVDPQFGTGAVKVTPAHDPDDFEMGQTHNLEFVSVIDTHGKMTPITGKYAGMDRYECRKAVVKDLEEGGYLVKIEPYNLSVGHCHRCGEIVEPLISEQWFVKMKPLAEPAIEVVKNGTIRFVPERFTKVYLNWMENVRDWCISRQLWWGHRIPAWYCQDCGKMIVSRETPTSCPDCGGSLKQDEDVLDTWFSSALWPFSTLGWPDETEDLKYFFPTDVLVTGYDIIFFWVARMIFSSMEQMKKEPFHHVVIHGMVRDGLGRKMSKSLGNGIDPLEVVEKFGADALRLALSIGTAMGNDMRLYDEKLEGARNFCNKLWNAARYCLANLEGLDTTKPVRPKQASGRWILSRLERTIETVKGAMDRYEPAEAIGAIMDFVWDEFCDWYIEISKQELADPELAGETKQVLWAVLKDILALLHPFTPFVTEELWDHLPGRADGPQGSLIVAPYPAPGKHPIDQEAESIIGSLIDATKAIRNMRAEVNIPTGKKTRVVIAADKPEDWRWATKYLERLAWAEPVDIVERAKGAEEARQALTSVVTGADIYLPLQGVIDLDKEIARLERAIQDVAKDLERTEARLENQEFLAKAPQEIVDAQRKRFLESKEKLEALEKRAETLRRARS